MSAPNLRALSKYSVNRPGAVEVVRQRLYDFVLYPAAGATQIQFFQNPVGQGLTTSAGIAAGQPKQRSDTNLELAGQLPAYKNFVIESIEVFFAPGSVSTANTFTPARMSDFVADPASAAAADAVLDPVNDVATLYAAGWLTLFIGSKEFLTEAPLGAFPPKVRLDLQTDVQPAGTQTTAGVYASKKLTPGGRPYFVQPQITLPSGQNFSVTANFPGVVAMPSGFNGRIGVVLDGFLYRNSQ